MVGSANAVREHMIRETMERLRVGHDCQHTNWEYRRGGGRCEDCSHHLPLYLFVSFSRRLVHIDASSDLTIL